jgi:hypothetical protein
MAITTQDQLVAARANTALWPPVGVQKITIAGQVAGTIASLWRSVGPLPTQPVIPAAPALCNNGTAGALAMPAVVGSNTLYLDELNLSCTIAGSIDVMDRVLHSGGLNGTLTTAQAVATPNLPPRAPAIMCEWFLECYIATGATTVAATVNVDYSDGTLGQNIAVTLPVSWQAGRLLPIIPAIGKYIARINNITLSGTTGIAGNFGVTAARRLGVMANIIAANLSDVRPYLLRGIASDACVSLHVNASTTSTGDVRGHLVFIQG